ncbi:MAG TPA: siderophore-interacting protein [Aeromicrobium sp.]|nr:siderophore-interacting protein [Aeromicrobium sp.]
MARTRRPAIQWPTILRELTVAEVADVSATTRRVTLVGEQLGEFAVAGGMAAPFQSEGFDDHVKLLVPLAGAERPPLPVQGPDRLEWGGAGGRPVAKDYTPRSFRPASADAPAALELDFVLHDGGFAAGWARGVKPGELAWIVGPTRSLLLPTDVDELIVAGDETALPAIARLLEQWPAGVTGNVVIEVPGPGSKQDLATPAGVNVVWVHGSAAWIAEVEALKPSAQTRFCWLAGESGAVRRLRKFASTELAIARDCLDATGYWRA